MTWVHVYISKRQSDFDILQRFYFHKIWYPAMFLKNKTLAEISQFTVLYCWLGNFLSRMYHGFSEDSEQPITRHEPSLIEPMPGLPRMDWTVLMSRLIWLAAQVILRVLSCICDIKHSHFLHGFSHCKLEIKAHHFYDLMAIRQYHLLPPIWIEACG